MVFVSNRCGIIRSSYVFLILLWYAFPAMPRPPEQPPRTEVPRFPFLLASRFDSRETSQAPYDTIQAIVREQDVDFSVFRLIQTWPESLSKAPPSPKRWYVAVIGTSPPEPLLTHVRGTITQGELVPLPGEVIAELARRRLNETAKAPYVEIHRTFTGRRKKDKEKRKQQKKSRRRNRGT